MTNRQREVRKLEEQLSKAALTKQERSSFNTVLLKRKTNITLKEYRAELENLLASVHTRRVDEKEEEKEVVSND